MKDRAHADKNFNEKWFIQSAQNLMRHCAEKKIRPGKLFQSPHAGGILFKDKPEGARGSLCKQLKTAWNAYLEHMGINEQTLLDYKCLPHCTSIGGIWEKSACPWNKHTDLCARFQRAAANLGEEVRKLDSTYREWRSAYLAGPRKPSFRFPSARDLPMPKIFGDQFFEVDLARSRLRLRLDDAGGDEWVEFGFIPWPRAYSPSRDTVCITSVHVNFIGCRVRAGFRFEVPHRQGRIAVPQDDIDRLRSQEFPRRAQDQAFLDAARKRIVESFVEGPGQARRSLRVLAVDVGMTGAACAVFEGARLIADEPLPVIKADRLYFGAVKRPAGGPKDKGQPQEHEVLVLAEDNDTRGVRKEHIGRHLGEIAKGAAAITAHRAPRDSAHLTLRDSDLRGLKRHIAWMIRDWVRLNAAAIIGVAERHQCDLIVFESLRGKRVPSYDKIDPESERKKQEGILFAYGQLRRKVTEKAVERGMRTVTVPYHKSSRFCSACGHEQQDAKRLNKNKREQRKFICECGDPKANRPQGSGDHHRGCRCRAEMNSDSNAARVLARVFWGDIRLPTPGPADRFRS